MVIERDATSAPFLIGSWLFDDREPLIRRHEEERRLEDRAARTLAVLCARRGEVVSRDDLIAAVWKGRSVSPNSVAIVIGSLRRALGDDPAEPIYIVTVGKRGYRLTGPAAGGSVDTGRHYARFIKFFAGPVVLAIVLIAVLFLRSPVSTIDVDLVVEKAQNDTGQPSLDPLTRSITMVVMNGATRLPGVRVLPSGARPRAGIRRVMLRSRLIIWNGAPEVALTATTDDGAVVIWSSFASGPPALLARHVTARIDALGPVLRR